MSTSPSTPTSEVPVEPTTLLVGLALDHLCALRVSDLVDAEDLLAPLDDPQMPSVVARFNLRFLVPQRLRWIAAARASSTKLGAWLPDGARDELAEALGEPAFLPPKLVDEAVATEQVRDEVRAMLHDSLTGFLARAAGSGAEGPTGLRGALGRGALGFAAAGKTLLGGIGDQVQRQLQERVRDFVDGSVSAVQSRIAERLKSKDTAVQLGKRRRAAFLGALESSEAEVADVVEKAPHDLIERLIPELVRHNLARPELRQLLIAEVDAILTDLSSQTIGELLDDLGIRAHVRQVVVKRGAAIVKTFGGIPRPQ